MYAIHDVVNELCRLWLVRDGLIEGDVYLEGDTWLHMATYLHSVGALSDLAWEDLLLKIKPRLTEAERLASLDASELSKK